MPSSAVSSRRDGAKVKLVVDGVTVVIPVQIRLSDGVYVEMKQDIDEGD